MPNTRRELDVMLQDLQERLPGLLAATRPECWLEAFTGVAKPVRDASGPQERHYVEARLNCILRDAGLVPGDDEPCG